MDTLAEIWAIIKAFLLLLATVAWQVISSKPSSGSRISSREILQSEIKMIPIIL